MKKFKAALPILLLILGAVGIFIGVNNGEAEAVMKKAVSICMECIGIG